MKALRHRHYQGFNVDELSDLTDNSGEVNSNSRPARGPKVITAPDLPSQGVSEC